MMERHRERAPHIGMVWHGFMGGVDSLPWRAEIATAALDPGKQVPCERPLAFDRTSEEPLTPRSAAAASRRATSPLLKASALGAWRGEWRG